MIHTEKAFEDAIEAHLLEHGYTKCQGFDRELALDTETVIAFLKDSQPEKWEKLAKIHGVAVEKKIIQRLCSELGKRGTLDVIRKGFTDYGTKFDMAYFQPASGLNPDTERLYGLNRLTVCRQVKYSKKNENTIDMLLSLNGLPIATVELKNQFTGQDVSNAKKQFIYDRDPKELLFKFKQRALVHFAVDTDEVYMTTKLEGKKTHYLPFNKGYRNGAGNPPNPQGYKTAYLWEEVWAKDSWMDIIGRFLHIQVEDKKEKLIFPRYHQLDAVRRLTRDARDNGSGKNYLIQHSAGSGKSNSIAWLAYRLASLHDTQDNRVFHSVIVVTDRKVLDQQLQNTIYQFEHKQGVVQKIDKHSSQLAEALEKGANIIITTLQKFPFVLDKIGALPSRNYAVIVDEAHSSQGGEAAKKLKEVLTAADLEDALKEEAKLDEMDDSEDELRTSMLARGRQDNLSFFAFTATPKAKTLEVFGERDVDGKPVPFHLYSMKQAIEEGFIMDVLKNYTTYQTFYNLSKQIQDDPQINKKKAVKVIARFVSLHPHNLAQKAEVMIEHFMQFTRKKIYGKAKAMVITPSRLHVVRYKAEFDKYIKEKGYDIKALVAFSGSVNDTGLEYTEAGMNKFGQKELPEKFNTDEYQLLLVANKYQTGFDQPLLHTMYVDKKITGVKAVQTLSRLNRIHPGKEDTFILDFVNDRDTILESFKPFYEETTVSETADPNQLYDLKNRIETFQVIWQKEIDAFCQVFYKPLSKQEKKDHAMLNSYIDPAVKRYKAIGDEKVRDDFKHTLVVFTRLYSFLSQIMPFTDIELEKFYTYGRFLHSKLRESLSTEAFHLAGEVELEYYRLQKMSEGDITIDSTDDCSLKSTQEAGMRKDKKEEQAPLSEIIEILNERFGTDFTETDRLAFVQIEEALIANATLAQKARVNTKENFKFEFDSAFLGIVIDRMEQNREIFTKILDDKSFNEIVKDILLDSVYRKLHKAA